MCNPASFAITKTGRVLWSKKTDSHSEIIAEHKLREDRRGSSGDPTDTLFVKIEINPPKLASGQFDFAAPLSKWKYVLDESRAPEWYDAKKCERLARLALKEWVKSKLHKSGTRTIVDGELVYVCVGDVVVKGGAAAVFGDSSKVTACGNSKVTAYGNSKVTAYGSSNVTAYGRSNVTACGNSIAAIKYCGPIVKQSGGLVVDYTTSPPSIYGAHQDGKEPK